MEVERCRILDSSYSIWFENELFQVEKVEAKKTLPLSSSQLCWFQEAIEDLCQQSEKQYFYKKGRVENGITESLKVQSGEKVGFKMQLMA